MYAPGEQLTAADSALGLDQFNKLLDQLSNESLACFAVAETSFPLVVNKTAYTIGKTGSPDINAQRPLRLREGVGAAYSQDSNGNNYPIDVVTRSTWNTLGNRTTLTQSNIPQMLFYDPQFPMGIINIWPTPNVGSTQTVFFDSMLQLTDASTLVQSMQLPPGYEAMLQSNLAVQLWPFYKNSEVSRAVSQSAITSKRNVKRTNSRSDFMRGDPALVRGGGAYNVYTDSYRPG